MCEPVNPPSTEAGRNAFIDLERDPPPQSRQYWEATIVATEEQARQQVNAEWNDKEGTVWHYDCGREQAIADALAEGRQQAVPLVLAAVQEHLACACGGIEGHLRTRGLTGVAGLNASESGQPPDDDDLASHLAVAMVEAGNPSQYKFIGEHAKAIVKALRRQQSLRLGDASESGQPPEASDE